MLSHAEDYPDIGRAANKLKGFVSMMDHLRELNEDPETSIHLLYRTMLETTGYLAMWEQQGEAEAGRVDNLNELASSILNYEKESGEEVPELAGFLEEMALMTDVDNYDASSDAVVMMTMHAAKGLEFPVVFLPGFEDGVFPGYQTLFDPGGARGGLPPMLRGHHPRQRRAVHHQRPFPDAVRLHQPQPALQIPERYPARTDHGQRPAAPGRL